MGVKDLWKILEPARELIYLDDFAASTVAIDLGFWLTEMQTAVQSVNTPKLYLRSLFFRVWALMQRNITVIAVADGAPPEIKQQTIAARLQNMHVSRPAGGADFAVFKREKASRRLRFRTQLRECCQMLRLIGVRVVEADGEAEALCSALNSAGIVDAVVTDDGDAFLYGARVVCRNFTLDSKRPMLDCYRVSAIVERLKLDREKMIALALLIGCDYCPTGVAGVGKQSALRYVQLHSDGKTALQRMKSLFLGHDDSSFDSVRPSDELRRVEETLARKLAGTSASIPFEKICDEFFDADLARERKCALFSSGISVDCPQVKPFQEFMHAKLEWTHEYALAKVIPVLIRWNIRQTIREQCQTSTFVPNVELVQIVKERTRDKLACVEVQWKVDDSIAMIVDDRASRCSLFITIELKDLIAEAFPRRLREFEEAMLAKKAKKRGQARRKDVQLAREAIPSSMIVAEETEEDDEEEAVFEKSIILFSDSDDDDDCVAALAELPSVTEALSRMALCDENDDAALRRKSGESKGSDLNETQSPLPLRERLQRRLLAAKE